MMYAYGTTMDTFAWQQSLGYGTHFNDHMRGYAFGSLPWMDDNFYPVKERLIDDAETDPDAPFLVDIGGNVGHDLELFHRFYPIVPGKLILQDLPVVIGQIQNLDPSVLRMEYDFHTKQPVKGMARKAPSEGADIYSHHQAPGHIICITFCTTGQTMYARKFLRKSKLQ
jgi:hypothetical protein